MKQQVQKHKLARDKKVSNQPALKVEDLRTYFFTREGVVRAVDGINFEIYPNEAFGLVGESGCGKSMTALSILRLVPPPGKIMGGKVYLRDHNLMASDYDEICSLRGNRISIVFQDPMTYLNPVFRIGDQIAEGLLIHQNISREEAWKRSVELMESVRIVDAADRAKDYPFQFSGGMRQRVMIAMAIANDPELIILDEPTTALDVTIQAQIMDLVRDIQGEHGMGVLLITHDLGVVADLCQRVAVMYAGKIVELAKIEPLFETPRHPYTIGLFNSLPRLDQRRSRLTTIEGQPPNLARLPKGCSFAIRCSVARPDCISTPQELREVDPGHWVRCWLVE
ncbi:MAG: ABC transporter ATP-binding protein [Chloroflexi bacterium]|nr:ABC transporter ATP-binding protein [Chloroflexota bacterium]